MATAWYEGEAAVSMAEQQKAIADYNASVNEAQATQVNLAAMDAAATRRTQLRSFLSQQSVVYGTSGVTMSGSPLKVRKESAKRGGLDIARGKFNASIRAGQFRSQGELDRLQGESELRAGKIRRTQAFLNVGFDAAKAAGGGA